MGQVSLPLQDFTMAAGLINLAALPENPIFSLIGDALSLSDRDLYTQVDTVLQHQAQSGLTLYLPRGLRFVAQLGTEVDPINRLGDGSVELMSRGEPRYLNTADEAIRIQRSCLQNSGNVFVHELVIGEDHYLPISEDQLFVKPLRIDPTRMFTKRDELLKFLNNGSLALPSYLDPSNDLFAPELALAIKLHQELVEQGRYSHLNVEDKVHHWLTVHRQDLSPLSAALVRRMSSIINPRKKRGNAFSA